MNYYKYSRYLKESTVRNAHDKIFRMIKPLGFDSVIDLGCGLREFQDYCGPERYMGLDKESPQADLKCDYRTVKPEKIVESWHNLYQDETLFDSFVSLFSVEPTSDKLTNWEFYHKLFRDFPHINRGLSSGFYYKSKLDKELVQEEGFLSYQTLSPIHFHTSDTFEEFRIEAPVPSQLFGPDVYEVWRVFERKT